MWIYWIGEIVRLGYCSWNFKHSSSFWSWNLYRDVVAFEIRKLEKGRGGGG